MPAIVTATQRIAAATLTDRPALTTIPGVEILAVGQWDAHTPDGRPATVTSDDLAAMVAAARDGHVRAAIVKLGHDSILNDGTPAFGRVDNLRLSDDGMTLVGDLVGVPTGLADIVASAFPRRSAEWYQAYTTDTGRSFDAVLTAVSLLGEAYPAVETLADIQAIYAGAPLHLVPMTASAFTASVITASRREPMPQPITARVEVDEIVRSFYESTSDWSWVREVYIDPPELIIDDEDNGGLYRLPYTIVGDTVEFGDRTAVRIDYIDQPITAGATTSRTPARVFASKAESRPNPQEEVNMDENVRKILVAKGLDPEKATEEQINEANVIVAALSLTVPADVIEEPVAEVPVVEPVLPVEDPIAVAATAALQDTNTRLAAAEARLAARDEADTKARRDGFIAAAVSEGRISPAQRDHYRSLLDIDEPRTTELVQTLAASVPLAARGGSPSVEASASALEDQLVAATLARHGVTPKGA